MQRTTSPAAAPGLPDDRRPPLFSRRQALQAGVVAASASAVAVAGPALGALGTPDAELSYLWRQFDKARVDYHALVGRRRFIDEWVLAESEARTREFDEMVDRVDAIVLRIAETPCTTLDGLRLKARIAADPDFGRDEIAASIVEDLNDEGFGR